MSRWIFLSYELSGHLSGYGNGERFRKEISRSMAQGDTSNNSVLHFPAHTGTHIDFPFHFCAEGKTGSHYEAGDLAFSHIRYMELPEERPSLLITPGDLASLPTDDATELLILKTGFCHYRHENRYWEHNPGFAPECASFLKTVFPSLRAVAFDSISLSSWQHRDVGRIAHRAFLCEHDLLIVEDADLTHVSGNTDFHRVIISPLRFDDADGTPVTIFAEISER